MEAIPYIPLYYIPTDLNHTQTMSPPIQYQAEPLSYEEVQHGEIPKTCARCGSLYFRKDDLPDACAVHVGSWQEGNVLGQWSCCKVVFRSAAPCTRVPHVPAAQASDNLKNYLQITSQAQQHRTINESALPSGSTMSPSKKRVIRADSTPKDGILIHHTTFTDTLDGLSLKYDLPKSEIIKANRGLSASNLFAFTKLVIPVGDAEVIYTESLTPAQKLEMERERLRVKFSKEFKCTKEEAKAYLSSHDYIYEEAAKNMRDDLAFEAEATSSTRITFSSKSEKFPPIKPK